MWPARPAHCSEIPALPQVPRPGPPVSPSRRPIPLTSHLALNAQEVHLLSHKPRSHILLLFLRVPWSLKLRASS